MTPAPRATPPWRRGSSRRECAAVVAGADADDVSEAFAERGWGGEPDQLTDLLNRSVALLQELLCPADALAAEPLLWGGPGLMAELPAQRAGAHRRTLRDVGEREVGMEVVGQPGEHRLQGASRCSGWLVGDELRL